MEKQLVAALPLAAGALIGVELAALINVTSTAGRVVLGFAGALAGILAAQAATK